MVNHIWWLLINDPSIGEQPGVPYRDAAFTTPVQLSAACEEVREFLVGDDGQSILRATAITTLALSPRYGRFRAAMDQSLVWPPAPALSVLAPQFLCTLDNTLKTEGRRLMLRLVPSDATLGPLAPFYTALWNPILHARQPFDRIVGLTMAYCLRAMNP